MASLALYERVGLPAARQVVGRHPVLVTVGLGVVLAAVTWPAVGLAPQAGIDQGWQAGLDMARHQGLGFGSRIQFAYGPLGFLTYGALYYTGPAVAAAVWLAALRVAVMASLVWSLRRSFRLPVAAALAWVAGVGVFLIVTPEPLIGLVVVWCLALPRGELTERQEKAVVLLLGGMAGLGLLVKFSVGLVALVLALVAVIAGPRARGRRVLLVLDGFVVATIAGWVATGNHLLDLVTWVTGSVQVTAGYSGAMGLEVPTLGGDYWRAPVVAAIVLAVAALEVRSLRGARRWGVGLLVVAVLAASFKEGFVRHNLHSLIFFGVAVMALAGLRARAGPGAGTAGRWPPLALGAGVALLCLLAFDTASFVPRANVDPVAGIEALAHQAGGLDSSSSRAATVSGARAAMRAGYGLDPATLALVKAETVWIEPSEESVAWAYPSLSWDPPPLFQDYVAYTPWLDRQDAGLLGSSDAPARILRQPGPVLDGRYPAFTPPATQVALVCNYAQLRATARWQVLAQVAPRCSQPTVMKTVHTGWDRWVTVPAAPRGDAVLAAWRPLPRPLGARLAGIVLRPPVVHIQIEGPKGTAVATYRFIPATAGDQHLVVPPSTLGSTGPYVPTAVRAMRLTGGGLGRSTSGVTVTFYAMPVLPAKP